MNDLKSYYEQFVGNLSVLQQRIVQLLSLNHTPLQGKKIAQMSFLEPNVMSKQLSILFKLGFIDKHKEGKNVYYEIKEPLMRICFEINENPEGSAKLFVDFLKIIYDEADRKKHYLKYKLGANYVEAKMKSTYINEADIYGRTLNSKEKTELKKIEEKLKNCALENLDTEIEKFITQQGNLDSKNQRKAIIYFDSGISFYRKKEFQNAIIAFKKAIQLNPKFDEAYYGLGDSYIGIEEFQNAIKAFKKVIQLNPENNNAYNNLGNSYRRIRDFQNAITAFKKAIKLNPENDQAYYNLGLSYGSIEEFQNAIMAFKTAIDLNPKNYEDYIFLGLSYIGKVEFQNAITTYKKAIQLNPKSYEAYNYLGFSYLKSGKFQNAITAFKKAIQLNPENVHAYNSITIIYLNQNQLQLAKDSINKALDLKPKNPFNMGSSIQVNLYQNDWKSSKKILSQIFKENLEYSSDMIGEDIIEALCKWTPEHLLLDQFIEVGKYFKSKEKSILLYEGFTFATFNILIRIENYSKERLSIIQQVFENFAQKSDKVIIPSLMLKVGIDYLQNGNKEALYDLSKEERQIFDSQVLQKRKHLKK